MIYYTADLHFGHKAIIPFSQRPFATVEDMDQAMIENWNRRVQSQDTVYILGDFCYRNNTPASSYLKQLKGKKHLITGNHDSRLLSDQDAMRYIESANSLNVVHDPGGKIVLCHYPLAEWNGLYKGWYHAYGHIHNRKDDTFLLMGFREKALNAGVDVNHFQPVTLAEMIQNNRLFRSGSDV